MRRAGRRAKPRRKTYPAVRIGEWIAVQYDGTGEYDWKLFKESFSPSAFLGVGKLEGLVDVALDRSPSGTEAVKGTWFDPRILDDGSFVIDKGTLWAVRTDRETETRKVVTLLYIVARKPDGTDVLRLAGGPSGNECAVLDNDFVEHSSEGWTACLGSDRLDGLFVPGSEVGRVIRNVPPF